MIDYLRHSVDAVVAFWLGAALASLAWITVLAWVLDRLDRAEQRIDALGHLFRTAGAKRPGEA